VKALHSPAGFSRRQIMLALVIVLVAGVHEEGEATSWHEETVQKTVPVRDEKLLVIITKSGDITVTGEEGRGDIALRLVKKVKADDAEEAKHLASQMELEINHEENILRINTVYPKLGEGKRSIFSYLFDRYPKMRIELFLTVPDGMELEIETASGDVSIEDMSSTVDVTAASGDVEVNNVAGGVVVHVASGDIEVMKVRGNAKLVSASGNVTGRDITGSCFINTVSGDVDLEKLGGDLELRTVMGDASVDGVGSVDYSGMSGSVRFIEVRGGVSASAASGDLSFQLVPAGDFDYTIHTSSGGIKVRFLEVMAGGYILKAMTTSGDIEVILPIEISKVGRNHVAGIVRDGKSKVILETASGDISISEPEE
jgi:DUF4097 and DUF4098 domain-containing protein YvlB